MKTEWDLVGIIISKSIIRFKLIIAYLFCNKLQCSC